MSVQIAAIDDSNGILVVIIPILKIKLYKRTLNVSKY